MSTLSNVRKFSSYTQKAVALTRSIAPLESSSALEGDGGGGTAGGGKRSGTEFFGSLEEFTGAELYRTTFTGGEGSKGIALVTQRIGVTSTTGVMLPTHRHRHHRDEFTQELPYLLESDTQDNKAISWGNSRFDSSPRPHTGGSSTYYYSHTGVDLSGGTGGAGGTRGGGLLQAVSNADTEVPIDGMIVKEITSMDNSLGLNKSLLDSVTYHHHNVPYFVHNSTDPGLNVSSDSMGGAPAGLGPEERTSLIVLYTLTTLLAVLGNVLVILVFTLGKRSRTDLRMFLINLAFADLIMAIFCMPFTFTMTMLGTWVFSAPMCPIVLYMQTVSVTASVCTNMAIGIDRFWVVSFPLKSRLTKSRSRVVIFIVWAIALSLSSVQLVVGRSRALDPDDLSGIVLCEEQWPSETWRRVYTFFILILTYLLPLSILSVAYGIVAWKLWQRTAPGNADQARDHQQLRSKRKVIKMLSVVVLLFGICWLPLHVFFLLLDFAPSITEVMTPAKEKLLNGLYYTVHWLAMSNSCVNPIIYGFLNDSFRSDLKRLLRRWMPCCRWLPCLATPLTRESTILVLEYSRYGRRASGSSTGTIRISDSSKKLLSLKVNGVNGRLESEVGCRNHLLSSKNIRRSSQRDL